MENENKMMSREAMQQIIEYHNEAVRFLCGLDDCKVPAEVIFKLMPLSSKLAATGLAIALAARSIGIEATVCMQSGKIYLSGKEVF